MGRTPRSTQPCWPAKGCSVISMRTAVGALSMTTTWWAPRRSWRRWSSRSSCGARATATKASVWASTSIPMEDAIAAVKRSVLQWRFIDSVAARIDDAALREAQKHKDAVRDYEIVYTALGGQ